MRKKLKRGFSLVVVLILIFAVSSAFVGCNAGNMTNDNENEKDKENTVEKDLPENDKINWPHEKTVKVEIEGMEEEMDVKLYKSEEFGFITYYPREMLVKDNNESAGFYYTKNGSKNEDAFVKIIKHGDKEIDINVNEVLTHEGWERIEEEGQDDSFNFALEVKLFENEHLGKTAIILPFEFDNQLYSFLLEYKHEYGDGFYARTNIIIENFYFMKEEKYLVN